MFDYKKLTTEQLTEIYETAKQEIIRRKQVDIAKLQVELSALENENVTSRVRGVKLWHLTLLVTTTCPPMAQIRVSAGLDEQGALSSLLLWDDRTSASRI